MKYQKWVLHPPEQALRAALEEFGRRERRYGAIAG